MRHHSEEAEQSPSTAFARHTRIKSMKGACIPDATDFCFSLSSSTFVTTNLPARTPRNVSSTAGWKVTSTRERRTTTREYLEAPILLYLFLADPFVQLCPRPSLPVVSCAAAELSYPLFPDSQRCRCCCTPSAPRSSWAFLIVLCTARSLQQCPKTTISHSVADTTFTHIEHFRGLAHYPPTHELPLLFLTTHDSMTQVLVRR